ncbi:Exoglucanase B precursor [Delftia tsuruhatensis]|nr:Exoglucanase B precursor [Delftia tsuruhatensis]CAC9681589.1 Exoglucanase B precursor [Delftia tsuruhatensis]
MLCGLCEGAGRTTLSESPGIVARTWHGPWTVQRLWMAIAVFLLALLPGLGHQASASSQHRHVPASVQGSSADAPGVARFIRDEKGLSIIEFSGDYGIDLVAPAQTVGKEFFRTHADVYDFLVVFSSFEFPTASAQGENALAFHRGVRNDTAGIGLQQFDNSQAYGSKGVLQSYIDMAAASRWSSATSSADYESLLSTFAHELQHRWASHVRFRDWNGQVSSALLGKDGSHWSYLLDSQGSVLYGASWRDNGDGSFTATQTQSTYSPLDLYLAGLIDKTKVPPFFLIEAPDLDASALPPPVGTTIRGTRRTVTIDDIIAAEGPRVPSADVSQKTFRFGFIYLVRPGETIDPADLDVVAQARRQVGLRYNALTHGLGTANVFAEPPQTTAPGLPGTTLPPDRPGATPAGNNAAGLAWLKARQRADGSFMDAAGLAPRDTLLARSYLRAADPTHGGLGAAWAWATARQPGNTDFLARRLIESTAGERRAEDASALLASRNRDGGWGLGEGLRSNPLDTALALQALRLVNADEAVLGPAVGLLLAWQNPDGGWGNAAASPSRVHVSAQALRALTGRADAQASLAKVRPFLGSRQNSDGGFGDGASSIHDTAHATMAMVAGGFGAEINQAAAQRFVAESQRMDGSWQGSVYSTALALQMLRTAASSNLAIAGLQVSPLPVFDGQRATLSARVVNAGSLQSQATTVRFFDGDPAAGGVAIGGPIPIAALVGGDSITVQTTWNTTSRAGQRTVFAVVDFEQATADLSRQDNTTSLSLVVQGANPLADLLLGDGDVLATPSTVTTLPASIQIDALVSNAGMAAVRQAKAVLWSGAAATRVRVAETSFDLAARATTALQFKPTLSEPGTTVYTVELDPEGQVREATRTNNSSSVTVRTAGGVSLAVSKADVSLNPAAPRPGADVMFTVRLRNTGTLDSSSFNVRYSIRSGAGTTVLMNNAVQIAAGASVEQQIPWRAGPGGDYSFIVEMDPERKSGDSDTSDNAASRDFQVAAKAGLNLAVSYRDLVFSPSPALEGSVMAFSAVVRNVGDVDATGFDVEFFAGDPSAGGSSIGATRVASLAAGASATVAVEWEVPTAGERLMFVVVDPGHSQAGEITREDNVAFASLKALTLPDFAVSQGALILEPALPKPGEATVLAVTVSNLGDQGARDLVVSAFNGDPANGIRLAPDAVVPALEGKAGATVRFAFDAPAAQGLASITVVVNPGAAIKERLRDNNTATISLGTQVGNYALSEAFISPDGDGVKDSTVLTYRLPGAMPVTVQVSDEQGRVLRTGRPAGSEALGSWRWNGLDEDGRLVRDGRYELAVRNADGVVLGGATVEVDTNRSPLLAAIGSPSGASAGLTCNLPRGTQVKSIRDGAGFYLNIPTAQDPGADLPAGIYRQDEWGRGLRSVLEGLVPDGSQNPIPMQWEIFVANEQGTRVVAYNPSLKKLISAGGEGEGKKSIYSGEISDIVGLSGDEREVIIRLPSMVLNAVDLGTGALRELGTGRAFNVRLSPRKNRMIFEAEEGGTIWFDLMQGSSASLPPASEYYWSPNGVFLVGRASNILRIFDENGNVFNEMEVNGISGVEVWAEDSSEVYVPFGSECIAAEDGKSKSCTVAIRRFDMVSGQWSDIGSFTEQVVVDGVFGGKLSAQLATVPGRHELLVHLYSGGGVSRSLRSQAGMNARVGLSGQEEQDYRLIDLRPPHAVSIVRFGETPPPVQTSGETSGYNARSHFIEYGRALQYISREDWAGTPSCPPGGDGMAATSYVFRTLANLQTDLVLSRLPDGVSVKIHGGAADRNFHRYWLEYSHDESPDTWHPVIPASAEQVWRKDLAIWVPPGVGRYTVRLTAEDLAGNKRQKLRRMNIAQAGPAITNVVREPAHFSPNGDGSKDIVTLSYRVLEPVNLEFRILNRAGALIRSISRNHPVAGLDSEIVWDGRDNNGEVVVDGEYRINVVGFDFFVNLDNTVPVIRKLTNGHPFAGCLSGSCRTTELEWDVFDAGFDSVQLEVGDGVAPARWRPYSLEKSEAIKAEGILYLPLSEYSGKRYRLTAKDLAGNRTVMQFDAHQQAVKLLSVGQILPNDLRPGEIPPSPAVHMGMSNQQRVELRPSAGVAMLLAETLDEPVVSVSLLFNEDRLAAKGEWIEQPNVQVSPIQEGELIWARRKVDRFERDDAWTTRDRSSLDDGSAIPQHYGVVGFFSGGMAADNGIRLKLKLIGKSGAQYITNDVVVQDSNRLELQNSYVDDSRLAAEVYLETARVARKLEVFVSSKADPYFAIGRRVLHQELNSLVPAGSRFQFSLDGRFVSCADYEVRAVVSFDNGRSMETSVPVGYCGGVNFRIRPEFGACDAGAPYQLHGVARPDQGTGDKVPLLSLEVYAESAAGARQLIFNVVNPEYRDYAFTFDHATWPEGMVAFHGVTVDRDGVKRSSRIDAPIDHTPVALRISYPQENQRVCAVRELHGKGYGRGGSISNALRLVAELDDAAGFDYLQEFRIGDDDNASWQPVLGDLPSLNTPDPRTDPDPKIYLTDRDYTLGEFYPSRRRPYMTGRRIAGELGPIVDTSGHVTARVTAFDWSGSRVCRQVSFFLDGSVQAGRESVDRRLFSPGTTSSLDSARLSIHPLEPLTLTVVVRRVEGGTLVPVAEGGAVRHLATRLAVLAGPQDLVWDGRNDAGQYVADGKYTFDITYEDGCGNLRAPPLDDGGSQLRTELEVTVDRTAPLLAMDAPQGGPVTSSFLDIVGGIKDVHLRQWVLEYSPDGGAAGWIVLASGTKSIDSRRLAVLDASQLQGMVTLRLRATDQVELVSEIQRELRLKAPTMVIRKFSASPSPFSPNGDGRLDALQIAFDVLQPAEVDLAVKRGNAVVRQLLSKALVAPGERIVAWDGRSDASDPVADGEYTVEIRAASSADKTNAQMEESTVVLDATPPLFTLDSALNPFMSGKAAFVGTLADRTLNSYQVHVEGPLPLARRVLLAEGSEVFARFPLGTLGRLELDDARYRIRVLASDDAGNASSFQSPEFELDTTAPAASFSNPAPETFVSRVRPADIAGVLDDHNLLSAELRINGQGVFAPAVVSSSTALSFTFDGAGVPDGRYATELLGTDKAGNVGRAHGSIHVDNTPPVAVIDSPAANAAIGTRVPVVGTASDANMEFWTLELGSGVGPDLGNLTVIGRGTGTVVGAELAKLVGLPPDGPATLRLTVVDKGGNASMSDVPLQIDATPPGAPVLQGRREQRSAVRLGWRFTSDASRLAGYNIYRNGKKLNASPVAALEYLDDGLSDGSYTYTVTALSHSGVESAGSNAVRIVIKASGPVANIGKPANDVAVGGLVSIEGSAYALTNFHSYQVSVGEGASPSTWKELRTSSLPVQGDVLATWDTTGLPEDAIHTIRLLAQDTEGGVSLAQARVSIDNRAPAKPLGLSAQLSGLNDVSLSWTANTEADLAGYLLYRNGRLANQTDPGDNAIRPYLIGGSAYLDKALPDGSFVYTVVAVDKADNLSGHSNPASVVVDNRPPQALIVQPANNADIDGVVYVQADSPDTDIASVRFEFKSGAESTWTAIGSAAAKLPYSVNWDTGKLPHGSYQLRAVATDVGGRTDPAPAAITVRRKNMQRPQAPAGLVALVDGADVALRWTASAGSDVRGYHVQRIDGEGGITRLTTDAVAQTSFVDRDRPDASHRYQVLAVNGDGNASDPTPVVTAVVYTTGLRQPYTPVVSAASPLQGRSPNAVDAVTVANAADSGASGSLLLQPDADGKFRADAVPLVMGVNLISARQTDDAGNRSRAGRVRVARGEFPAAPASVQAVASGNVYKAQWAASTSADVAGYVVSMDGKPGTRPVGFVSATASSAAGSYANAERAIDAYDYTAWEPDDKDPHPSIEVVASRRELVSELSIVWSTYMAPPASYAIEAWDGYVWVPLKEQAANAEPDVRLRLEPPYFTDRLRISLGAGTDAGRAGQVSDVQATALAVVSQTMADVPASDGRHTVSVQTLSTLGLLGAAASADPGGIGDFTPPPPVQTRISVDAAMVTVRWSESAASDLARYEVLRDGRLIASVAAGDPLLHLDGPLAKGRYAYAVRPVDQAGNVGDLSNEAVAEITCACPGTPLQLRLNAPEGGGELGLAWQAPASGGGVAAYAVYRADAAGGPYRLLATTPPHTLAYTDATVVNGSRYFYRVRARDTAGNEGDPSNEVDGVAMDRQGPAAPVIFHPTDSAHPIATRQGSTAVRAFSEPAARVALSRNGVALASVTATAALRTTTVAGPGQVLAIAPRADLVAMVANDTLTIRRVSHALDGSTSSEVVRTVDGVGYRTLPAWSPDASQLVLAGNNGPVQVIQVADGSISEHDLGASARMVIWHPDGTRWIAATNGGRELVEVQVGTGASRAIAAASHRFTSLAISPDGRSLGAVDGGQLVLLSLSDGQATVVAPDGVLDYAPLAWSSDAQSLYFLARDGSGSADQVHRQRMGQGSPVAVTAQAQGVDHFSLSPTDALTFISGGQLHAMGGMLASALEIGVQAQSMEWARSGLLLIADPTGVKSLVLPGTALFPPVTLKPGENLLAAQATDAAGNAGVPSAAIRVTYAVEPARMPDFSVAAADVSVLPQVPQAGVASRVTLVVRNAGTGAAPGAALRMLAISPSGGHVQLLNTRTPALAAGDSQVLWADAVFDTAGDWQLSIAVDADNEVQEVSEDNNVLVLPLRVVGAAAARSAVVRVSQPAYAVGSTLSGSVELFNGQAGIAGQLRLGIEDAQGNAVAALPVQDQPLLAYGQSRSVAFEWRVAAIFDGAYRVRASWVDGKGLLAQSTAAFQVLPHVQIEARVRSDSASYVPGSVARIVAQIDPAGSSPSLGMARAFIRVLDPAGKAVLETSDEVGLVSAAQRVKTLDTSGLALGTYAVQLQVVFEGREVARASGAFDVAAATDPVAALTGDIVLDRASLPYTGRIAGTAILANSGSLALDGLQYEVVVLEPRSSTVLARSAQGTVSLPPGAETRSTFSFAAQGMPIGPLWVQLRTSQAGRRTAATGALQPHLLRQREVALFELEPPTVVIRQPLQGAHLRAAQSVQVAATDLLSGVRTVEFQLNGGAWQGTTLSDPVSSSFVGVLPPLADGMHQIMARATDHSGNVSQPVQRSFVVDSLPPVITISGVTQTAYAAPVAPTIEVTDPNLSDTQIRLDGAPHVSGTRISGAGSHVLQVDAIDLAGNTASQTVRFSIQSNAGDTTPPVIDIRTPLAGAYLRRAATGLTAAIVDAQSTVAEAWFSIDGGAFVPLAVDAGQNDASLYAASLDGLADGVHSLVVRARDTQGNEASTEARSFTVDNTPPVITISGVAAGQYAAAVTPVISVTDLALHTSSITLNGATHASGTPVAANGDYTLSVEAVDRAGNSATATLQFSIRLPVTDTTAPAVFIEQPAEGAHVRSAAELSVAATDSGSGVSSVEHRFDAQPQWSGLRLSPTTGKYTLDLGGLADGAYAVSVRASDNAGNVSAAQLRRFTVDNTAPRVMVTGVAEDGRYPGTASATIVISDTHLAGSSVMLNGQPYASGRSIDQPGAYALVAAARDIAGNETVVSIKFEVTAGNTGAPVVTITAPAAHAVVKSGVLLTATVQPAANVSRLEMSGDAGASYAAMVPGGAGAYEASIAQLADGPATLRVRAVDSQGTRHPDVLHTVTVDNTPPAIAHLSVADGGSYPGGHAISFTVSDLHLESVASSLDGQPFSQGQRVDSPGRHVLLITARDRAGNQTQRTVAFTTIGAAVRKPVPVPVGPPDGVLLALMYLAMAFAARRALGTTRKK